MSFRDPLLLALLAGVPLAAWLILYAARRRREAVALFLGADRSDGTDTPHVEALRHRRRWRGALLLGVIACWAVALAGPRLGMAERETRSRSLDLIVALDVSASMLADDVPPSRLERAALEVRRLAERRPGDRRGLIIFAGDAFLQMPLTTDEGAFRLFLDAAAPDLVATPGTNFSQMLRVAEAAFGNDEQRPQVLLIVSDGENHEEGLGEAADRLGEQGVELLALGVGTEAGAPVPDPDGRRFKMENGERVISRYSPEALRQVASGEMIHLGDGDAAVQLDQRLAALDRTVTTEERVPASAERFQWPLALGLLLLVMERWLATRPLSARAAPPIATPDETPDAEPQTA